MTRHRRPARRSTIGGGLLLLLVICGFIAVSITGFRPLGANAAEAPVRCMLTVPSDPLSARGLATPYKLSGHGCFETDKGHAAFVQATVFDPATSKVANYAPLVITRGTRPAVAPVVPTLPKNAVVGIWFGFNGDELALRGTNGSLRAGSCVNGAEGSIFGQYAYCNAPAFFTAANAAIAAGTLTVPDIGTGSDGLPCPTTRDFGVVDQDQSDNVTSKYFAVHGRLAQGTSANAARFKRAVVLTNASDNGLVANKLDPVLGCTPWTAPDLGDGGQASNSLALNELQAAKFQAAPAALVPLNNPMTMTHGRQSIVKTDAYRAGVDMPPVSAQRGQTPAEYCRLMTASGWQRMQTDRALLKVAPSPDPTTATTLYTFLGSRIAGSYDELGCARLLKHPNPFQVTMHGAVAVAVRKGIAVERKLVKPHPAITTKAPTHLGPSPLPKQTGATPKADEPTLMKAPPKATPSTKAQSEPQPTDTTPTPFPIMSPSPTATPTPTPSATAPAADPTTGPTPTPTPSAGATE